MKRSSTRSCSGFWDTVRNNLTIREMTARWSNKQKKTSALRMTLRRKSFYFLKKQKKKHQAFLPGALCGAPPGTRTLGPLIKRNQRATIDNFQNYADSLFLSLYRNFAFCIRCILCTCHPLLHPLSSRSGVQKVCKNVQSQNQPLKTGIGFLCNGVKTGLFHPAKGTLYITNLYHTSNVHQQFDSWQGYGQSN